MKSSH